MPTPPKLILDIDGTQHDVVTLPAIRLRLYRDRCMDRDKLSQIAATKKAALAIASSNAESTRFSLGDTEGDQLRAVLATADGKSKTYPPNDFEEEYSRKEAWTAYLAARLAGHKAIDTIADDE